MTEDYGGHCLSKEDKKYPWKYGHACSNINATTLLDDIGFSYPTTKLSDN